MPDIEQVQVGQITYDIRDAEAIHKVASATNGNFAGLDANGNVTDSGSKASDFKTVQTAVTDPTASGTGLTFISTLSQNTNGVITPAKATVQDGTTSQKGVVQLEDSTTSTSTTTAATPNSVKAAKDAADAAQSTADGKKDIQTAVSDPSASGTGITFISGISQDAQGVISPSKKTVRSGTTSQTGVVQLSSETDSSDETKAATPKAVQTLGSAKADKSQSVPVTVPASGWGSGDHPTQTINVTGVTSTTNGEWGIGAPTEAQLEAMQESLVMVTAQGAGTITVKAYGETPAIDLPYALLIIG